MSIHILALLLLVALPVLVVAGLALALLRALMGSGRSGTEDETRMIQETYSGLARLEERIEALETLILDKERKEGAP
jgi:phage shock protein B